MADRIDSLVSELATKLGPELRKCSVEPDPTTTCDARPYMSRAKRVFAIGVKMSGGASLVAEAAGCDESNVRLQLKHPDRSPTLDVAMALPDPEALDLIADEFHAIAAEKRRALRRAG